MMRSVLILGAVLLVTPMQAMAANYSCQIDAPRSVVEKGATADLPMIGFPAETANNRKFMVTLTPKSGTPLLDAKILWPGNPMNIEGEYMAFPTGVGAMALVAISGGPCLFTETACAAVIQIVDQPTGPAQLLILPTALSTDREKNIRKPFVAIVRGTCTKGEGK